MGWNWILYTKDENWELKQAAIPLDEDGITSYQIEWILYTIKEWAEWILALEKHSYDNHGAW